MHQLDIIEETLKNNKYIPINKRTRTLFTGELYLLIVVIFIKLANYG